MWPRIARMFEMEIAEPVPMPLSSYMTDKADLWCEIATKYGLLDTPYEKLVSSNFADFIFNSGFDNVSSTIEAWKAGFAECIDSEEMLLRLPARQEGHPLTSVEPISHRHGDGARLANVGFCTPAALMPVQGLFLRPRDRPPKARRSRF
jgi:hypothetical protein